MKLLVFFAAFLAFCAGNAIPLIPGDNSHYVEGVSRYIWMPDGDGVPHLVDLEEHSDEEVLQNRNGADNVYLLYTRGNPTTPQSLIHGNSISVWLSNYSAQKPLKVIVHGWNSNGYSSMNPLITAAFLAVMDTNVIVVDWGNLAGKWYGTSAAGVPDVGVFLGNFLEWLISTHGGDWNQVQLVGFSLGAHIVGNAGRATGGKPARITGLDPAGPLWGGNANALTGTDGQFVEAIHTAGGTLGIFDPIATVNFYPNGGRNAQPGCWFSTCSHSRAPELFAASVYHNKFVGSQCQDLNEAQNVKCNGSNTVLMGNANIWKYGNGLYGLTTEQSWPF